MSWVTIIWSLGAGACLTLAVIQFFVWWKDRSERASLVFSVLAISVASFAALELALMRAQTPEQLGVIVRWLHVPAWVMITSLVAFVRLYLRAGPRWLGWAVVGVRAMSLILNFVFSPNINYRNITAVRHIPFLGGTVSFPEGVPNPWMLVAQLSLVLLIIFVVDAAVTVWRRGDRRQALVVGGGTVFFVVLGSAQGIAITWGVISMPPTVSLFYQCLVWAMAYELGCDVLRVRRDLAERVRLDELVASMGAAFVNVAPNTLDEEIQSWMQRIVESLDADRIGLFELADDYSLAHNTHQATREGVSKLSSEFSYSELSWYLDELRAGRPVIMSDVNKELLGQATAEREFARKHGTRAVMGFPLSVNGVVMRAIDCVMVHKTRVWSEAAQNTLRLAGQIFTQALTQRRSETALREFEEKVVLAADAANLGVWELDTATNEIWMSEKARALFGFSPNAHLDHAAVQERVNPQDRARRDAIVQAAVKTQGEYKLEYRILLPNKTTRWINGRGRCVYIQGKGTWLLGVSMDVTAEKQAQELFVLATEASPSGTVLVDHQGGIVLVNAHAERLFGYTRDELVGKGVEILVPERLARTHGTDRAKFFVAPEARPMGAGRELFARRKDGSEFPVEIGLNPIQTPQGLLVLANVVDISPRLAAEEEARRRREQVELLGRVSLLGEMTASLAHELNQPLGAIVNNATAALQYLEQGRLDPEKLKDILTDVVGDGRRAYDIMHNVRSAIKKGSAIRGRLNLNDAVKAVTYMVHADAAAQFCKLEISLASDLPVVEGDPTQIQQVIINLLRNAFDAMRDTPHSRRVVEIATSRNGDGTVSVAVRDYGCGIPEATRERLFEQFFTTKEEGLGMGLAIVRSIVEAHGGSIAAENADGGGARFYFSLPVKEETPQ